MQPACTGGVVTTLSGKVYDPAGQGPALQRRRLHPEHGARRRTPTVRACDTCATALSGMPIVQDQDRRGRATSRWVTRARTCPWAANIPLVIQVGKLAARGDDRERRRVRRHAADRRRHDAPAAQPERGPPAEDRAHHRRRRRARVPAAQDRHRRQRVHGPSRAPGGSTSSRASTARNKFNATLGGAGFTSVAPWWDDVNNLRKYDMILHSCDGTENPNNKSQAAREALQGSTPTPAGACSRRTGTTTGSSTGRRRGRRSPTSITRRTCRSRSPRPSTPASRAAPSWPSG